LINLAATKLAEHWIDGNVRDPWMLATITFIAVSVTLLASLRPASRAARIDPMGVLRTTKPGKTQVALALKSRTMIEHW
jgi:predicted lysophospholipase L1 biosynthesis ABC-type transport system permease subunit